MIIQPMIRNNVCLNAHPDGCAAYVQQQIEYVRQQAALAGPKRVLVIGSSAGYGLATRIVSTFAAKADTLGVAFERPASGRRSASAGWYAYKAYEAQAKDTGLYSDTIIGDAFSHEVKQQVVDAIKASMGKVDLVVYSLASPLRVDPDSGERYSSVLKPIGAPYHALSVDSSGALKEVHVAPATEEEIAATIKVMGGEDWELWIQRLSDAGVLAEGARSLAYSYIGPELTYPLYRQGTIGRAKEDLEARAASISKMLGPISGAAYVSVNKALVTRASSVIPVVPLYLAILYKVMQEKGIQEGCIEQMYRLFAERLNGDLALDAEGRIRMDDWEMREDVQQEVSRRWEHVSDDTIADLANLELTQKEFLHLHGFGFDAIDYTRDVNP